MASDPTPGLQPLPAATDLQFEKAEFTGDAAEQSGNQACAACKRLFGGQYYYAQGQVVCPACAERIQSGQQAPPKLSLARAALYGGGAGLLGCIIYATIAILFDLEIGIVAILVGYLVGKAIRHASGGLGGRAQQILAVVITYFSITTSYIPVYVATLIKHPPARQAGQGKSQPPPKSPDQEPAPGAGKALVAALSMILIIAAAAPFLSLGSGVSGLITLFIIFLGLQRAWRLTGRTELLVMGPYEPASPQ